MHEVVWSVADGDHDVVVCREARWVIDNGFNDREDVSLMFRVPWIAYVRNRFCAPRRVVANSFSDSHDVFSAMTTRG